MKTISKISSYLILCMVFILALSTPVSAASLDHLKGHNPYIYVSDYEVVDGVVEVDSTFTLRVYITNANPTTDAYNIMSSFYFVGSESFIMPKGETNQHYIPYVAAGASTYFDITLDVKDSFILPTVDFEFAFTYDTSTDVTFTNSTFITLMQYEKTELSLDVANPSTIAQAGKQTHLSINSTNSGKTEISNVTVTVTGDFTDSPLTFTEDELSPSASFAVNTYIMFDTVGESDISITATYENERGESFDTEEQAYTFNVTDANTNTNVSVDDSSNTINIFEGNSFWFYITAACGGLILILIIMLVVKMIKLKHKKEV